MKTPITLERLKTHLTYSWWKYLLGVAGIVMAWNIFFSVTSTRAAENEKVELYVYGGIFEEPVDRLLELMREREFPDQAQFGCFALAQDTTAGVQAFSIRVATGDGDLLLIPRATYETFAQVGLLEDLDAMEGVRAAMDAAGLNADPARDWWQGEDGERRCYGIPAGQIAVLNSVLVGDGSQYYLCLRIDNGNTDVARRVLIRIIEDWTVGGEGYSAMQLMMAGR